MENFPLYIKIACVIGLVGLIIIYYGYRISRQGMTLKHVYIILGGIFIAGSAVLLALGLLLLLLFY